MGLSAVDYGIIVIIGLSMITGLFRGFVKELIALCVWLLAFWLGYKYAHVLTPWLKPYIDDQTIRMAASFILILLATLLMGGLVNAVLSFILYRTGLNGTDRILGMVFGFVRGTFIVSLFIVVLNMTSFSKKEDYAHKSLFYAQFNPLVHWLSKLMPSFIHQAKWFDKEEEPALVHNNMN
ncbi:MAG: colicin V synthesis protein [Legionellales bacterium RIFCSPHIGHO2_12_FULL_42_9]|nr:MAG: colicin V synthesis protein [Legionellales bacterium RIFCSPHIGHO2_12_FULL_42_9]